MFKQNKIHVYVICLMLVPYCLHAAEGVDVSFAVQAIQIQDIIKSQLSAKAHWSLVAADIDTGKRLIADKDSDKTMLQPGSLVKLFITAAILDANAQKPIDLDTVVAISGEITGDKLNGSVIIKGAGNSFLSSKDLLPAVDGLKLLGISKITGNIVVDDSLFRVKGWKTEYKGAAYGVPSALGLDLHTVAITVERARRSAIVEPANDAVNVRFMISGKPGIRQIDDVTYEVTGASQNAPALHGRFSLNDPAFYAGGTFLTMLNKQGIAISGKVKRGKLPAGSREVARVRSLDLSSYVRQMDQQSLNTAADNLLFLLGAMTYGAPGTRKKGIQALTGFLRELGVPSNGMVVDDGSGLSEKNRASSDQIVAFLQRVARRFWFSTFKESLSRPGIDGILRDFSYTSEQIRAKSGQLREAYCLAGYVDRMDGRKIAFSYMVNGNGLDMLIASTTSAEVLRHLEGK